MSKGTLDSLAAKLDKETSTIIDYCVPCKRKTIFVYVGQRETASQDYIDLYDCSQCGKTRLLR